MMYERSLDIERRLEEALSLIRSGTCSTPVIAQRLRVSIPTASRYVTALRERGHHIAAERRNGSWRYVLQSDPGPVRKAINVRRKTHRERKGNH